MFLNLDDRGENVAIAKLQSETIHKGRKLFLDPKFPDDLSILRSELGLPSLNKILSNHYGGPLSGFAWGKIYNFYGPESVGKSAMALQICGEVVRAGGTILWVDKEGSFDPVYALAAYGLDVRDTKHVIVAKPNDAEEAFNIIQSHIDTQAIHLYVVDSVSALGTASQNDKEAGRNSMGEVARKLSEHFPRIINKLDQGNISGIYINQLRTKMAGMVGYSDFTGGNAMHFFPHVALNFKPKQNGELRIGGTGELAEYLGQEVNVIAKKNKTSRPKMVCMLTLYPGEGFSREADILELAIQCDIVKKSSAWFKFELHENKDLHFNFQGINNARAALKEDSKLTDAVWELTLPLLEKPVGNVEISTGEILDEQEPIIQPNIVEKVTVKVTKRKKIAAKVA